jgi:hypothetical protein
MPIRSPPATAEPHRVHHKPKARCAPGRLKIDLPGAKEGPYRQAIGSSRLRRGLHHKLVNVAPAPVLSRLETPDDRVPGAVEMFGRVLSGRFVAAADVPARETEPQVNPLPIRLEAFLAAIRCAWPHIVHLAEVCAPYRHHGFSDADRDPSPIPSKATRLMEPGYEEVSSADRLRPLDRSATRSLSGDKPTTNAQDELFRF